MKPYAKEGRRYREGTTLGLEFWENKLTGCRFNARVTAVMMWLRLLRAN